MNEKKNKERIGNEKPINGKDIFHIFLSSKVMRFLETLILFLILLIENRDQIPQIVDHALDRSLNRQ